MTAKKETFPKRTFLRDSSELERTKVSFTLEIVLKGDVCSKEGVANDLEDTLTAKIEDMQYDTDIVVDSFELIMTEFKAVK